MLKCQTHAPSELLPHSSFELTSGPRDSFYQHLPPYLGVKYIHHTSRAYQPLMPLPYLGLALWMVISLLPRSNAQLESAAETPVLGEASSSKKQWNCWMTFMRKCFYCVLCRCQIIKKYPILEQWFHNAWPTKNMIQNYLSNTSSTHHKPY